MDSHSKSSEVSTFSSSRRASARKRESALPERIVPRRTLLSRLFALSLTAVGFFAFWHLAHAQENSQSGAAPDASVAYPIDILTSLGVVVLLNLLNGTFAMAETALVSLRRTRIEQLVEEKRSGARTVQRLLEDPPRMIATVQVVMTLLSFFSAAAAATTLSAPLVPLLKAIPGVAPFADTAAVVVVTIIVALFSIVVGEIVPKTLALQAPDIWALRLAPLVSLFARIFSWLTYFVVWASNVIVAPFGGKAKFETPMITREEFEQIVDQGERHGELDDEEAKIITNVFDLSETAVRAVMTPRIDMTALSVDAPLGITLETILQSGHSRIPVYEGTIDNVIGIIHAKDLLPYFKASKSDVDLRIVMRGAFFVPETKKVADLLAEMRRDKFQMAIVRDEYSGTAGLVTLEDLIEEIVGEIRDEYDVDEPELQVVSETETLIDARMGILDVNDRLGVELPHDEYDTIGGLVFGVLGHEPVEGERIRLDGLEFRVERVVNRRVRTIRAVRLVPSGVEEGSETALEVG
ncbi:MAG: hemolysin family protein [Capsulimonadales bacterium]|nr:hemolysin family protein [Capsulimonadales bacterium]